MQDPPKPNWKEPCHSLALCPHNRAITQDLDTLSTPPSPSLQGSNKKKLAFPTGKGKAKHSKKLEMDCLVPKKEQEKDTGKKDKCVSVQHQTFTGAFSMHYKNKHQATRENERENKVISKLSFCRNLFLYSTW